MAIPKDQFYGLDKWLMDSNPPLGGIGKPGDFWLPTYQFDPRQGKGIRIIADDGVVYDVALENPTGTGWRCTKTRQYLGYVPAMEIYTGSYEMCMVQFDEFCDQIYMTMLKDE